MNISGPLLHRQSRDRQWCAPWAWRAVVAAASGSANGLAIAQTSRLSLLTTSWRGQLRLFRRTDPELILGLPDIAAGFGVRSNWSEASASHEVAGAMRFTPHLMARVAPRPVALISPLRNSGLTSHLDGLATLRAAIREARSHLSDELHAVIGQCDDRRSRNALIAARRAVFNGRSLSAVENDAIESRATPSLRASLSALKGLLAQEQAQLTGLEEAFECAHNIERDWLPAVLTDDALRKGLVLSSESLHSALTARRSEWGGSERRRAQVERGALRYLTRMVMKATPFGTFCHVLPVRSPVTRGDAPSFLEGDVLFSQTVVRLNKGLYGALWQAIRKRPAVRAALQVRVSPTLRQVGGGFEVLTVDKKRETFRTVRATAPLQLTIEILSRGMPMTLGDLTEVLCEDKRLGATRDEVWKYLEGLVELGLLQVASVVEEQEAEWHRPLEAFLGSLDDTAAAEVAATLRRWDSAMASYRLADADERAGIIRQMRADAVGVLRLLDVEGDGSGSLLFEDATAPATCIVPRGPNLTQTLNDVAELGVLLARIAPTRIEHATMRRFYDLRYAPGTRVPLIDFYRDYYRESKKERLANAQRAQPNIESYDPYHLPLAQEMNVANATLSELVVSAWQASPNAEELRLSLADVREALNSVRPRRDGPSSFSCYLQLAWRGRVPRAIAKAWSIGGGHGRYFSRFLHLLPMDVVTAVRQGANRHGGLQRAELLGDAYFNGNLHPPLLDGAIAYPTSDAAVPHHALNVCDIDVMAFDGDTETLLLVDRQTGSRVVPVDLGFLAHTHRPPLFQMLVVLGNAPDMTFLFPRYPFRDTELQPGAPPAPEQATQRRPDIVYRPRILIGDFCVVARRRWSVRASALTKRQYAESDSQYFIRVNEWRAALGMPTEVYVSMRPVYPQKVQVADADTSVTPGVNRDEHTADGASADQEAAGGIPEQGRGARRPADTKRTDFARLVSSDAIKPQFVNFSSPMLVGLFERIGGGLATYTLEIEERYPVDSDLLQSHAGAHTYELCIQFDSENAGDATDVAHASTGAGALLA